MTAEITIVQAIDSIGKLLPFLKSFTGARRREYFDTLLSPLVEKDALPVYSNREGNKAPLQWPGDGSV